MDYLKVNHFKCFEKIDIPINKLTVLAGANGNGKSTVIQALLYLRHTIEHCGESNRRDYSIRKANGLNVPLNGVYGLALGSSSFVLNQNYDGTLLSIGLYNEKKQELMIDYEVDNENAQLWLTPWKVHTKDETDFPILRHEFYYLNAERVGPRINQSLQFFDFPNAGWQGESTAQLIGMENGYYKIEDTRRFEETKTNYLIDQVNYWLGFIMKNVKVKVETNAKTLTSQILLENAYTVSEPTLATNLGFGISYILPIIATGLIAKAGSYFLVENPEAHLHPSAQSKIGRFLAMVAQVGVHVIVETHSDHVINGIQIAAAKKEIDAQNIGIQFFNQPKEATQPQVESISVNEKGELSKWPKGFFDQTQIDFAELFKLRKRL